MEELLEEGTWQWGGDMRKPGRKREEGGILLEKEFW